MARVEIYLVRTADVRAPNVNAAADEIVVTMADDGPGVDLTKPRAGLGLIGMRERVEAIGGEFHIASQPGSGFLFCARVPVQAGLPELNELSEPAEFGEFGEMKAQAVCHLRKLHAVVRAELLPDHRLMVGNGLLAQAESFRDARQRIALHQQTQHLELARR